MVVMCSKKNIWLISFGLFSILQLFFGISSIQGQSKWQGYYSYRDCFDVIETNDFIVGATKLGLIFYHKETASLSVRNKINGLSDSGISAVGYAREADGLLVGYQNGNIDLIKNGNVFNIPDLRIENIIGSKKINHFYYHGGAVLCSTDFGILEINIDDNEIASTFIIGDDASFLKVYATIADEDYIYAATSLGVLRADAQSDALAFYGNWELFSDSQDAYNDIVITSKGVIGARGEIGGTCDLVLLHDTGSVVQLSFSRFRKMAAFENEVLITTQSRIHQLEVDFTTSATLDSIDHRDEGSYLPLYRSSLIGNDGSLWLADGQGGLFHQLQSGAFEQLLPPGPYSNTVYRSKKIGNELWIVPGGFGTLHNNGNIPPSISILKDNRWVFFEKNNTSEFSGVRDLINIAHNPLNFDDVFVASWGNGLFELDKDDKNNIFLKHHYLEHNSKLQNVPTTPKDRYTRIWGLTFDENANLFLSNSSVAFPLVVYNRPDSAWYQYGYGALGQSSNFVGEILIDRQGLKWLYVLHGEARGLFVFDDNGTIDNPLDDRYRSVISQGNDTDSRNVGEMQMWDENREVLTKNIYAMAMDKSGYIWLGTDIGVVVQYNPANIFNTEYPVFTRIKVPRLDGSGLADFLLENQSVTVVAIDGANRKYFGTEGSGFYIISEDGLKTVDHFTTSNSPLPSNSIINIDIDEESGEVYVSTTSGLISYMGDAVKGESEFSKVLVFPNPVRPGYEGPISITGLMDRTNVKITDTAGNLVYETISLGGKALWSGKNLWGQKVKAGIYIVFLSSPDGGQAEFTKIAVIR
jgi:hypothetical protein